jgi:hypothetical protein
MNRTILIIVRWTLGMLTLIAVVTQIATLKQLGVFNPYRFLSYFTNLSNIFAAIVFLISVWFLIQGRQPTVKQDISRGASVLFMIVTGIIYALPFSGDDYIHVMPWITIHLHYIMPMFVILDWLYQPALSTLTMKQAQRWLIVPFIYLVYCLYRGSIVRWYPYPFLNPDSAGGYAVVLLYCFGILAIFYVLTWPFIILSNNLKRNVN